MLNLLLIYWAYYYKLQKHLKSISKETKSILSGKSKFYREMWSQSACALGAEVVWSSQDFLKISRGDRSTLVNNNLSAVDNSVALHLAGNKRLTYEILDSINVPFPDHMCFTEFDLNAAKSFMATHEGRVVVKPAYSTGAGNGVSTNVRNTARLLKAVVSSKVHCPETIIEEQRDGQNYRLLILDGKLIDCVLRLPPKIHGNGKSNLRELIKRENALRAEQAPRLGQSLLLIDLDMKNTLADQNLSLRSVLETGQSVCVKTVINENRLSENHRYTGAIDPSTIQLSIEILKALGLRLGGVDIIAGDITKPLLDDGGVVIDVNSTPGLYHHFCEDEVGRAVAAKILERCLEEHK